MNLAGLAFAPQGYTRARSANLDVQAKQDEQDAMDALGRTFGGIGPGAPQPGGPRPMGAQMAGGPQQMPQPSPQPQGGGQSPPAGGGLYPPGVAPSENSFMNAGAQKSAPQQAPAPQQQAPQQASPAPQQGMQGGGNPPGAMGVEELAKRIIAANPGIMKRPRLLVAAIMKGQALLSPEAKMQLAEAKQQLAQQKAQMAYDAKLKAVDERANAAIQAANSRTQVAEINSARDRAKAEIAAQAHVQGITINVEGKHQDVKTTEEGKAKRQETSEEGKDSRLATAEEGKGSRLATAEAGRNQRVAAKPGGAQGVQGINAQIRVISSKIADMFRGGLVTMDDIKNDPVKKAEYDRLVAQRDALAESAGKAGVKVEPFDAKPKKEDAAPKAAALPADLPPPKGLADGTTAKGADGKVVAVVKSGEWATP